MIIYYSGEGSRSNPEIVLADKANLMLTFATYEKKGQPDKRFQAIIDARRLKLEDGLRSQLDKKERKGKRK